MGITIHYSGTFRSDASLAGMVEEAVTFAEANNWKFTILEKDFPAGDSVTDPEDDPQFGIILHPPECESVHLCFNQNRQLGYFSDLRQLLIETWVADEKTGEGEWVPEILAPDYEPTWGAFTKTHTAGAQIHKKICELLKEISAKYIPDLKVNDDTDYWIDGDESYLKKVFGEGIEIDMMNFDPKDPKYRFPEK